MKIDRTGLRDRYPASWRWLRIARRIAGWLTDGEGNALFELARAVPGENAVVVELGSWQGKSSVLLAAGLAGKMNARLVCVDPFGQDEDPQQQRTYYDPVIGAMRISLEESFRRTIRRCGAERVVEAWKGYSFDAVKRWQGPIDLLFIDASHSYEAVHRDLLDWSPFLRVGGVVALHDVSPNWPGPSRVMAEDLQAPYFGDLHQVDSLLWAVKMSADLLPEQPKLRLITIPKCDFDARQEEIARLSSERQRLTETVVRLSGLEDEQPKTAARLLALEREHPETVARLRALEQEQSATLERLWALEQKNSETVAALEDARREIASLRSSLSWRITAPLRRMLDLVTNRR